MKASTPRARFAPGDVALCHLGPVLILGPAGSDSWLVWSAAHSWAHALRAAMRPADDNARAAFRREKRLADPAVRAHLAAYLADAARLEHYRDHGNENGAGW